MLFTAKIKSSNSNSDKRESIDNNINNNIVTKAFNLNMIVYPIVEGRNSKSEVPSDFINNNNNISKDIEMINHKISKSEIYNLQVDLKKIHDNLERKKQIEDENLKLIVSNRKKLILDKFFKCKL